MLLRNLDFPCPCSSLSAMAMEKCPFTYTCSSLAFRPSFLKVLELPSCYLEVLRECCWRLCGRLAGIWFQFRRIQGRCHDPSLIYPHALDDAHEHSHVLAGVSSMRKAAFYKTSNGNETSSSGFTFEERSTSFENISSSRWAAV